MREKPTALRQSLQDILVQLDLKLKICSVFRAPVMVAKGPSARSGENLCFKHLFWASWTIPRRGNTTEKVNFTQLGCPYGIRPRGVGKADPQEMIAAVTISIGSSVLFFSEFRTIVS